MGAVAGPRQCFAGTFDIRRSSVWWPNAGTASTEPRFRQVVTKTSKMIAKASGDRLVPWLIAYTDWISAATILRNLYTTKHVHDKNRFRETRGISPRGEAGLRIDLPPHVYSCHQWHRKSHNNAPTPFLRFMSFNCVYQNWDWYPYDKTDSLDGGAEGCARGWAAPGLIPRWATSGLGAWWTISDLAPGRANSEVVLGRLDLSDIGLS